MPDHSPTELAAGVSVRRIESVSDSRGIAAVLDQATGDRQTVVPFGGTGSLGTGNASPTLDIGLDVSACRGILAYEPTDLTFSVKAGTTWSDVQSHLAANGQELPLDVPFPDSATVGGVMATGFAGARRLRSGSLRDLIIGCEFVRGDGMIAKAGGMVVKNVSGFEIPRFLHGSWGSLAVISSVNLKVVPIPRADGTVLVTFGKVAEAMSFARRMIQEIPTIEAVSVAVSNGSAVVSLRAMGRSGAVNDTLSTIRLAGGDLVESMTGDESRNFWQNLANRNCERSNDVSVAIACLAKATEGMVVSLAEALPAVRIVANPGYGSVRVMASGLREDETIHVLSTLDRVPGASFRVIESMPEVSGSQFKTWGDALDGMELMRSIKRQFDPGSVLNPGRLSV